VAHVGMLALTLTSGCIRIGYDASRAPANRVPDASHNDGGAARGTAGVVAAAAAGSDAAVGGSGGSAAQNAAGKADEDGGVTAGEGAGAGPAGSGGAGSGGAGSGGAGSGAAGGGTDAGADIDQMLGDAGLRVSDILGFYSGDWGDMVLRKQGAEIWGAYERDSGTIVGQITGDGVFVGWWSQLPSRVGTDAGEVEFRWSGTSGTAIALDGRWRYGTTGDWLENWDVDLVTDRAAPSDLTARFDSPGDFIRHP
jgi:hypothetical protein